MVDLARANKDLVIANRILANLGLFDAFGDISVRHPADAQRFLLARPCNPGTVGIDDIMEFDLDGALAGNSSHDLPKERFLHAAIYAARPDVQAVLHAAPEDVLPFGITATRLRPVFHSVGDMGHDVPVWDMAKRFGGKTDGTVSTMAQARDLAKCLGKNRVVLIRGGGFVVTGRSLNDAVRIAVYIPRNARVIAMARPFGRMVGLSKGESPKRVALDPDSNAMRRGWDYWARQAGCGDLLAD
jgi:HCOMODA/2-hydroxy-3-carboxy-muconic semialdehyde decarboxylase